MTLIKNVSIVNMGTITVANVLIKGNYIEGIYTDAELNEKSGITAIIDGTGKHLIPGVIDDQVHFRDPGLTHKADIASESRAAVAGGVTSFMDMPNTNPPTTTFKDLKNKYESAAEKSVINYSFFFGATNDNSELLSKIDPKEVCGVKVFMGSSTGNMLVDNSQALARIFAESPTIIATHCEDEATIRANTAAYKERYGEDIPFTEHHLIRNAEACYKSTSQAIELATKYNAKLHVLHISTAKETELFEKYNPQSTRITAEACVHHMWFTNDDYKSKGSLIKCNPAIKTQADRDGIRQAVKDARIAVVATDHAPHTWEEKQNKYLTAPSGLPLVQHSLQTMLDMYKQGIFSLEGIVEYMCHNPARLFQISKRGFIEAGYYADLVLIDLNKEYTVSENNILYKCGWSPLQGHTFKASILKTWVSGFLAYCNDSKIENTQYGLQLKFDR